MSPSGSDLERLLQGLSKHDGQNGEMARELAKIVLQKNGQNALRFLSTPYAGRVVLVPQCLRSTSACRAEERNGEYLCRGCGACKIADIARHARELGYLGTRILKGGSAVARLVAETKARAVLGISCPMEGVLGALVCQSAGVPSFCVPLLKAGCSDTDVDLDDVRAAMEACLP
jgi:hypothetical protein